ncbi:MAG: DUF3048 domain-containing protein [Streptosporangiaceae bacterium]
MGWLSTWIRRTLLPWTREKTILAAVLAAATTAAIVAGVVLIPSSTPAAHKAQATPTPTARPSAAKPHRLVSPFTGEPVKQLNRVLAVKIDNIVYARPQTGLTAADIVYVLPVEGGLTRFLVIFSSHFPPVIGPVRSARRDDLQLLGQFGRPAFAFSGAQGQLLPVVEHARIVNLYAGVARGYYRDYSRIAPYNLFASTRVLLAQSKRASKARNIGFKFGAPPAGGRVTKSATVTYPAAKFVFTWSAASHRWLVSMDGVPAKTSAGRRFAPVTVVIQHTIVRKSLYLEYGYPPPYAETIGRGTAVVLRNGKAYNVRWSRRNWNGGTTFTTASGHPMIFAPGQVWILLVGNRHVEAG